MDQWIKPQQVDRFKPMGEFQDPKLEVLYQKNIKNAILSGEIPGNLVLKHRPYTSLIHGYLQSSSLHVAWPLVSLYHHCYIQDIIRIII